MVAASLVIGHLSVARIADALSVWCDTANNAVLTEGRRVLIADPARFDGVGVIGVDEHVCRHTRNGDRYVTVIIDLTPVAEGRGPGPTVGHGCRQVQAGARHLAARPQTWRAGVEVKAMDGFTGFKTATVDQLPDAVTVMDPFHVCASPVMRWPSAVDESNRTCTAIEGHENDPLFRARPTLMTGADLQTLST